MISHTTSVRISVDAGTVFRFMSDPAHMNRWSFGTWDTHVSEDGLIDGRAIATGDRIFLRIDADASRLLIDYRLGEDPEGLSPRIFARVIPGQVSGHSGNSATLILVALRGKNMDDARWGRLCRAHDAELDIVKGQIETGHIPGGSV